ncbi:MAG: ABC transporter permease [Gemmataceae bacterium]|nr:ABC transporter permease [Gemmataceae bacterium]
MEPTFFTLVLVCSALTLIQFVAALPWLAAIDPRTFLTVVRRPAFWGFAAAGVVGTAAGLAVFLEANGAERLLVRFGRIYGLILQLQLTADFFVLAFALLLWLWPKGGAVGLSAFRESLRQPMFWLLFIVALVLQWVVPFLPYFTLGEDLKMVKELGYDIIMLFTVLFAIIAASSSITEEIEGRTAVTLMSKPVSRREFLLGKFVGILLSSLVMVAMLGWPLVIMFLFKQVLDPPITQDRVADPDWVLRFVASYVPDGESSHFVRGVGLWYDDSVAVLPGLVIVSCQVMVLLAIATALATRLPMMVTVPIVATFYFLGHLTPVLIAVSSQGNIELVKFMAQVFDTILPGLEHFSLGSTIVRDAPLPPADFALYTANVSLYAVMYTAIALLFGLILFEDRDLA